MSSKAAITVHRSPDDVRRMWQSPQYRSEYIDSSGARVSFRDAPGDRGTEIHVELDRSGPGGPFGGIVGKLAGAPPLAKAKDELRRFKELVETGVIARSEGTPEGERAERKLKQRPAQPLEESELQEVDV